MKYKLGNERLFRRIAGIVSLGSLGFCLGALPLFAASEQLGQPQLPPQQQGDTYQPPPLDAPAPPQAAPSYQQVPASLTIAAGTPIMVRVSQPLSSQVNRPGDGFSAVLEQPIIVDGWVVARRGQTVMGRVTLVQKAGIGGKQSQLGVELTQLTLVDGQQLPLKTQLTQATGGNIPAGQTVATVAAPTGVGAAIGAIAGGRRDAGEGAGIGAAAGAAVGLIGVLLTPGRPTVIPPEALLTFRQEFPVNISTVRSSQAFQPVTQQDYPANTGTLRYPPPRGVVAPAAPPYYYDYYAGGYPYPYWGYYPGGYYPGPYFGFYGFYGPRVFVGPRIGGFGRGGFGGFRGGGFRR